jgi:hypothetical protein
MKFMHFSDNSKQSEYQGPPKLFKMYPVIQHLNNKFQNLYILNQRWTSLWHYGKVVCFSFRQYLPLNGAKFCIKTHEFCESSSSYVWSFLFYTGQGMELMNQFVITETNKTAEIVVKLLEHLGHI